MKHAAELRRCLEEVDVEGIQRLWKHLAPHLPQPESRSETIYAIHEARVRSRSIPLRLKAYSKAWLAEHDRRVIAKAVGFAVKGKDQPRVLAIREAVAQSVLDSIKAGIDIDLEAKEVRRRMQKARDKV